MRQGIYNTVKYYDASQPNNYATAAINWLQDTYNCCGLDSMQDWRVFYSLIYQQQASSGLGYFPNQYNINYNTQLTSTVPDSCCINVTPGCGSFSTGYYQQQQQQVWQPWNGAGSFGGSSGGVAQSYQFQSSYSNINSQGCMKPFMQRFQNDLVFLAAYCFGVSVVGTIICLIYAGLFFFLRTRSP